MRHRTGGARVSYDRTQGHWPPAGGCGKKFLGQVRLDRLDVLCNQVFMDFCNDGLGQGLAE